MSEELLIQTIDAGTNESEIRPFTDEEATAYQAVKLAADSAIQEQEAKVSARTSALAKLAALGLTEEEIAAL